MMDLQNEAYLVEKAKTDPVSFARLYDHYYPKIFGYVQRRTAGISIAQDITSDTFVKAMKNIHTFEWRGIPFSAWLFRIANHEIVNRSRKRKTRLVNLEDMADSINVENISNGATIEEELIEAEEKLLRYDEYLKLHKRLSELPVKYQEVIALRYFEQKPLSEISLILGKREGTVKSLLHRGLKKLRKMME